MAATHTPGPKPKPVPGHKCQGAQMAFHTSCECGWSSGNYGGKGARAEAYGAWHDHVATHRAAIAKAEGQS